MGNDACCSRQEEMMSDLNYINPEQYIINISGFSLSITKEMLLSAFRPFGEIKNIEFIGDKGDFPLNAETKEQCEKRSLDYLDNILKKDVGINPIEIVLK